MQDQSISAQAGQSSSSSDQANQSQQTHKHDRTLWIITGYVAGAVAVLAVLGYYFSVYVTH